MLEDNVLRNPFHRPIAEIVEQIKETEWTKPYLANLVTVVINISVISLFSLFYITFGVVAQIVAIFGVQIRKEKILFNSAKAMDNSIEASVHIMITGILLLCIFPFFLVLLPFRAILWIHSIFR